MTNSRRLSAWRTRAWTKGTGKAFSVVVLAKAMTQTGGFICGAGWPTFLAKHLPGVMGLGVRRDDMVEMCRSNSHVTLRHCEERSDEAIQGGGRSSGSPRRFAPRNDGGENNTSRSRGMFRPSFASSITLFRNRRAQGRPGGRCTRGSRAKVGLRERENHRYRRIHSGLPCAVVLRLIRDLPGEPCRLPPSPFAQPCGFAWT